jgi:hypothetical protein
MIRRLLIFSSVFLINNSDLYAVRGPVEDSYSLRFGCLGARTTKPASAVFVDVIDQSINPGSPNDKNKAGCCSRLVEVVSRLAIVVGSVGAGFVLAARLAGKEKED